MAGLGCLGLVSLPWLAWRALPRLGLACLSAWLVLGGNLTNPLQSYQGVTRLASRQSWLASAILSSAILACLSAWLASRPQQSSAILSGGKLLTHIGPTKGSIGGAPGCPGRFKFEPRGGGGQGPKREPMGRPGPWGNILGIYENGGPGVLGGPKS